MNKNDKFMIGLLLGELSGIPQDLTSIILALAEVGVNCPPNATIQDIVDTIRQIIATALKITVKPQGLPSHLWCSNTEYQIMLNKMQDLFRSDDTQTPVPIAYLHNFDRVICPDIVYQAMPKTSTYMAIMIYAQEIDFNLPDILMFAVDPTFVAFDGQMKDITTKTIPMTKSTLEDGVLFSATLTDGTTLQTIERAVVI